MTNGGGFPAEEVVLLYATNPGRAVSDGVHHQLQPTNQPTAATSQPSNCTYPTNQPTLQGTDGFPQRSLRGFARTPLLAPSASATLSLPLGALDFTVPTKAGVNTVRLGRWKIEVGGQSATVEATRQSVDLKKANVRWPGMGPKTTTA